MARPLSMNNSSYLWATATLNPSTKRKRISHGTPEPSQAQVSSTIKDTRVKSSKALNFSGSLLTILVGPPDSDTREPFYVHEGPLCASSPFFASAMKPEWASLRPDPKTIELPDDDPAAFQLYLTWMYSGQLPILSEPSSSTTGTTSTQASEDTILTTPKRIDPNAHHDTDASSTTNEGYHTLAYAYALGERLLSTPFKNAITDAYVLYARGAEPAKRLYPSNDEVRILYEGTRENSPIRQLLVDIWVCRGKFEWIEKDPDLPQEFLVEVTRGLLKARTTGGIENMSRPWKNSHEQYHDKAA